jgi:hypothetical protein
MIWMHFIPLVKKFIVDIDVAALYPCLVESICRFGSCCDLHQNRFPGRNLCYIEDSVFVAIAVAVLWGKLNKPTSNLDNAIPRLLLKKECFQIRYSNVCIIVRCKGFTYPIQAQEERSATNTNN